ncbi:MAG: hypothetical protein QW224_05190 [Desulfurococcaceae archaeon]
MKSLIRTGSIGPAATSCSESMLLVELIENKVFCINNDRCLRKHVD